MKTFAGTLSKSILILILVVSVFVLIPIKSNIINHFILSPFEKKFTTKLGFKSSKIWLPGNIFLEGLSLSGKDGIFYTAESVDIKYSLIDILLGKRELRLKARNVRTHQDINLLDSVSNILAIPKMPNVEFIVAEGTFNFEKDSVSLKNIAASTDNMKITGDGRATKGGDLNCTIHFSFSNAITNNMPEIVRTTLLTEEADGWMGITLKTSGNYTRPSLHIDSGTFIMNIKEGSLKVKQPQRY